MIEKNFKKPICLICNKKFFENGEDGIYFYEKYIQKNLNYTNFDIPPVSLNNLNQNSLLFFVYNKKDLISNLLAIKNNDFIYIKDFSVSKGFKKTGYGFITLFNAIDYFFKKTNFKEIRLLDDTVHENNKSYYEDNFLFEYIEEKNSMMRLSIEKFKSVDAKEFYEKKMSLYLNKIGTNNLNTYIKIENRNHFDEL